MESAWSLLATASVLLITQYAQCGDAQLRGIGSHGRYPHYPCYHHNHHHHDYHHCHNHNVTYTCGGRTSEKISYFTNPSNFMTYCAVAVVTNDPKVTQLRLDFEEFTLEQPTRPNYDPSHSQYPAYFCHNDRFSVASSSINAPDNLGFINLCGENSGQHIYIPVNAISGPSTSTLIFQLADRINNSSGLIQPQWRIKITQVDCTAPDSENMCAPTGCLQYYPGRSGTFESLNYNNGAGHYQGLLNYAICFKRFDDVRSVRYDSTRLQIAANDLAKPYGREGCDKDTADPAKPYSRDYLFIPDAHSATGVEDSLFCGDDFPGKSVSTNAPGPLSVFFRSDAYSDSVTLGEEIGFRITYSESGKV